MPMGTDRERLFITCPQAERLDNILQEVCHFQDFAFIYAGSLFGGRFPRISLRSFASHKPEIPQRVSTHDIHVRCSP